MKLSLNADQIVQMQVPVGKLTFTCEAKVLEFLGRTIRTTLPVRTESGAKIAVKVEQLTVFVPLPDAVYSLQCLVESVGAEELVLRVPPTQATQRIQRRAYVRVGTDLPCWVEKLQRGEYGEPFAGNVVNLSAGGCAIVNSEKLYCGTQVRLMVCLPNDASIEVVAKVKCERVFIAGREPKYVAGLEFQDINEGLRTKITRYVFEVEREKRKGTTTLRPFPSSDKA